MDDKILVLLRMDASVRTFVNEIFDLYIEVLALIAVRKPVQKIAPVWT